MTSHKEEPNPSILFGDSGGGDPFSQIQQLSEVPAKQTPTHEQPVVGDASSLFGTGGNADLFFSSAPQQTDSSQLLTLDASAVSFFQQPPSGSFFDGLDTSSNAAASLTQAYNPNTVYNQQQQQEQPSADMQQGEDSQQEYYQNQWIQFDPNVHYYYDEQGQVHYYDPNTNQEYDMSGYDQQTYNYQYDPQYAEYYAQQGYDLNAYAAAADDAIVPDAYAPVQESYDPDAYAPQQHVPASALDQDYQPDDYSPQAYAPVNAQVPAQIESEQTIDTQHYLQQQNYEQQQAYDYQGYEANDLQQPYAPVNQTEFLAEDLQQVPPPPPPKASTPPKASAPPRAKSVASPSPPQQQPAAIPTSAPSSPRGSYDANVPVQEAVEKQDMLDDLDDLVLGQKPLTDAFDLLMSTTDGEKELVFTHHEEAPVSLTAAPVTTLEPAEAEAFISYEQEPTSYEPQQDQSSIYDHTASYDSQHYEQEPTKAYQPQGEQVVDYSSYEPQQTAAVNYSSYEPQQGEQSTDYSHEPQQGQQATDYSYEPQQGEHAIDYSYEPQQTADYSQQTTEKTISYEVQQQDSSFYSHYEPPQAQAHAPLRHYVASPPLPPQRRNMISPPPPSVMQSFHPQRSNSTTIEPDRTQSRSPFAAYYTIERSATVPPPITERIASPRPTLIACPDPQCEGENKAKAKFCCECGRPLAGMPRSTTPAFEGRTVLDERKEVMRKSLKAFHGVHQDPSLALNYMDARIGEFESSKALLWHTVKLMIQYEDNSAEMDKAMTGLLSSSIQQEGTLLDTLENYLVRGDREEACQFAMEKDMWAHALIISQSHTHDHFKRVISKFMDRELFSSSVEWMSQLPADKKALRMLYSVFSGVGADAVLELARNSVDDHPTGFTKESLEGWQHALALILANRSSNDKEALIGLGNALKQVGSLYDASLCYVLAERGLESQILGVEQGSEMYYTDLDALYLTELYELATKTKLTQQNYKLIHAWWLSALGFTNEAQVYCDSITISNSEDLQGLKHMGENINPTSSEHVLSLLTKTTFDILIGSIESKVQGPSGSYDHVPTPAYFGQEASNDATLHQQGSNYNYGYGYGGNGGYTEPADNETPAAANTPFAAQTSPFQNIKPVQSPFGVPHGGYAAAQPESGWWGSESAAENTEEAPSYQPDAYTPASTDDDLGFGNSKESKTDASSATREEKPNEISSEDTTKPQEKSSGWGLFSLFSRKEKDPNSDEKKAVKANLGEQSSFYYDEKEKRWVNKLNDAKPATASTPPPPKASTPVSAGPAPPMTKPASMPPMRTSSTPNVPSVAGGGPPSAAPPAFNTPPATNRRGAGAGARKPMRSRYVDVLNTTTN